MKTGIVIVPQMDIGSIPVFENHTKGAFTPVLFSSIPFLYFFLPCVLLLYCLSPRVLKNAVLLLASLFFYAWGERRYVIWMLVAILFGYLFGLLIERFRHRPVLSKVLLTLSVASSLSMLIYFKYTDFFIANFNRLTGLSVPLLSIALPIGISFYTFQILSYTVDVYRGDVAAQRNPISLATYVALFPQLIAGPIVRYSDIADQLENRTHSFANCWDGIGRFLVGLGKKILLANTLGELCSIYKASDEKSVLFVWLYAVAYCLHVYFDFSGYSDMAIGLGKLFGFQFLENFNYPFISGSITEFWRRWHMSLGTWFRDYVYIPLGGNRVSPGRHLFNILVVWMLTGFWHGAAWNFIVWGLYFAVLLVLEKHILMPQLKKHTGIGHIYVLFFVAISFVIFDAANMKDAMTTIGSLFGLGGIPLVSAEFLYYLRSYGILLLIGIIGATPLPKKLWQKLSAHTKGAKVVAVLSPILACGLLLVCTAYLVDGSYNPFLYFRF